MRDMSFPPNQIDDQTELASASLPPADAQLVSDLHSAYASLAEENARSLQRVQARLAQHEQQPHRAASRASSSLPFPTRRPSKEPAPKRSLRLEIWQRRIAAVAAIFLLAALVGSMVVVLHSARQGKNATARGKQIATSASPTPGFQTFPAPTPAPGFYMVSQTGWSTNQISKIDPQTRQPIWSQTIGWPEGDIVIYGDTVYLTASGSDPNGYDNYIYALNAETGAIRWQDNLGDDTYTVHNPLPPNAPTSIPREITEHGLGVLNTPVLSDGLLFVGARDGKFSAFDASTGARRWTYQARAQAIYNGGFIDNPPVVVDQGVVYGVIHNNLFAVSEATGKELWSVWIDAGQIFNTLQIINGVLYPSSYADIFNTDIGPQHYLYAYTIQNGSQRWRLDLGQGYLFSSFVFDGGVFYYGSYDGNLYARNASDGAELWHYHAGGLIEDSPILSDGMVYINRSIPSSNADRTSFSSRSTIMAISLTSHQMIWQQLIPPSPSVSLEAVQSGVVYVGVMPGALYAYGASNGSLLWHQKFGAALVDKTGQESEFAPIIRIIG